MATALSLAAAAASPSLAADAQPTLLQELRQQRPDVLRWETSPAEREDARQPEGDIVAIGRVAARTAVRFADGRVRWYVVAGFRPVSVSRQPLEAGTAIDVATLDTAERDVIALGCLPVTMESSDRWRATRRLSTGDALCENSVERTPDVQRDHAVRLSTDRGPISVSREFTAAADARAGERVRLRDRATGAIVLAIVTGPGAARLPE